MNKLKDFSDEKIKLYFKTALALGRAELHQCGEGNAIILDEEPEKLIYIPDEVTSIEYLFTDTDMLMPKTALRVYGANNVENTDFLFSDCVLKELDLSKMHTSKVTSMIGMFKKCVTVKLDVSNFDTYNVTNMASMFYGCSIPNIDLRSFDTSKVENMNLMFADSTIENLNLTSFTTDNAYEYGQMFRDTKANVRARDKYIRLSALNR